MFGITPKRFDTVDMLFAASKFVCSVTDPKMPFKAQYVEIKTALFTQQFGKNKPATLQRAHPLSGCYAVSRYCRNSQSGTVLCDGALGCQTAVYHATFP